MKYKLLILLILISSCAQNTSNKGNKKQFNAQGFAYIYSLDDFQKKLIKHKLDDAELQIAHNKLRPGSLIKITNVKTNDSLIIKNTKRFKYPKFYKILITNKVAERLNLNPEFPLVEIIEVKKNKSFVAKKTKIFKEEEKIHSKAPVETVTINNISKVNKRVIKNIPYKLYILIAEFYSRDSAMFLKKRITNEMLNFDHKKLLIKSQKSNKTSLLSGPYSSVNLMKNDYILLNNFGFEELDIKLNE